jgi:starvation-inducible DNA-binding protein
VELQTGAADDADLAASRSNQSDDVVHVLNVVLADIFTLYLKTKSFHWHMSGPHFRDYHLLLDEQADQLFAMTDVIAERVRKIGGTTLRSIGHILRLQRLSDDDSGKLAAAEMLGELLRDNRRLLEEMRQSHRLCGDHGDVATTSLLETFIDEGERRAWFLLEASAIG